MAKPLHPGTRRPPPGNPPPPKPPPPAGVGVTDGIAPLCEVAAVATVEKSGAASAAPKPSVATRAMASFGTYAQQGKGQDRHDAERAGHRHEGTQGREPVGRAPEEDVAPHHRRGQAGGQADAPDPAGPALPQAHGGDADERAERRRQGHRVVGVDDALGQADDEADAHERAAPEQESGAFAVGATRPQRDDQQNGAHHQRAG